MLLDFNESCPAIGEELGFHVSSVAKGSTLVKCIVPKGSVLVLTRAGVGVRPKPGLAVEN
jgi:hypothetical protein